MSSTLPTDNAWSKAVKDFGLGPYDGAPDDTSMKGENDEHREPSGKSLPDGGAPDDMPIEYYLSYPQEEAFGWKHASGVLPGDLDRPPRGKNPGYDTKDDVVPTIGPPPNSITEDDEENQDHSHLPNGDLPSARSDYYDRTVYGFSIKSTLDQIWPDENSGAYAGEEKGQDVPEDEDVGSSKIPVPAFNEHLMDDFLGPFGNSDQGYIWEDRAVPRGFPTEDFKENVDFPKSNDDSIGGRLMASFGTSIADRNLGESMTDRTATDLQLVTELTKDFVKQFGKKNIVRRHVLAFLQDRQLPQYLASDIVRCLKHQHKVVIPDVMDTLPLGHVANEGRSGLGSVYRDLVQLRLRHSNDPEVDEIVRHCASRISDVLAALDILEVVDVQ